MSYGHRAFLGILFVAAGIVATKLSSFVAQLALGWLLSPEDYKLWGMLVALRMFVEGIRHGGVLPVMQQRGAKARDQVIVFFKYALAFNLASAGILLLSLPFAHRFFQTQGLNGLIILMAISFPLSTPGAFYRTQLSLDLQFSIAARITSVCAIVNYAVMVVCAALGMGPYSFVVPIVASALAEWWLYGQAVDRVSSNVRLSWARFVDIFRASKWIMLAAAATSVALSGDYLVIGRLAPNILGEYLFGFQLTLALAVVIANGFQQVLLPTFSRLRGDDNRLADAYRKSVIITSLVSAPLFAISAVAGPYFVHLLWAGKWDAAIPVVQVMSLCLVLRLLNPLAATALQAMGRWDIYAGAMALDAAAVVLAAWIGATIGGLPETAIAVGIARCLIVPLMTGAAARAVGLSPGRTLLAAAARLVMPLAGVLVVWNQCGFPGNASYGYLGAGVLALVIGEAATLWVYREDLRLVLDLFRRRDIEA
jgi:O-antigen/teichoic acid export membrane protein